MAILLTAAAFVAPALSAAEPVRSASVSAQVGVTGGGNAFNPSFSADGRFLVFVSHANNLVTNDDLGLNLDVFVHELATGQTRLVSVSTNGTDGANADANFPAISSNGQWIAFASAASNLVPDDNNGLSDIFVRDLVSGATKLVSVDTNGAAPAASSRHPLISAPGRWVFFDSDASTLVSERDYSSSPDVFARDMQSNRTCLVSKDWQGKATDTGLRSELASITPDGRSVAFVSSHSQVWTSSWIGRPNAYLRDLVHDHMHWVSEEVTRLFPNSVGTYRCFKPVVSSDGQFVAYRVELSLAGPVVLARYGVTAGTTTLIATNNSLTWPTLSADGRHVGYDDGTNVFVWDSETDSNVLVSVNLAGSGPANGVSRNPVMTPDARFVAFVSDATDLVAAEANGGCQIYVRDLITGTTRLVTVNRHGEASRADHEFLEPALRADGQLVAFDSEGDDLVFGDFNRASDVFVRDLAGDTTRLISQRHADLPATTGVQFSTLPDGNCMSTDGRWLAFTTHDNTLVPGDTNGWQDVIVRDLVTGSNRLVGVWTNPVVNPILSALSPHLLFTKPASFFDSPTAGDIYRHDLRSNITALVSLRHDGAGPANRPSVAGGISEDGRYVVFQSAASDLINEGGTSVTNVYLRDLVVGTNFLISRNLSGGYADNHSFAPMVSRLGRWVLFQSLASDLTTNSVSSTRPELFVWDRSRRQTYMASWDGTNAVGCSGRPVWFSHFAIAAFASALSPSGSKGVYLHFLGFPGSGLLAEDAINPFLRPSDWLDPELRIIVYQTWRPPSSGPHTDQIIIEGANTKNLVSVNHTGTAPGNGHSTSPVITADGRYVVFLSQATDLVPNDTNGFPDIFVHDRTTGGTLAVTASLRTGGTANSVSGPPQLGADGRTILFQSFASDLVPGDYNDKRDVFLLRLGATDSDNDGMDDDWEMAFFNTLSRDGTADLDRDGANDLAEFRAGTDPTNLGSVLRVMTLTSLGARGTTLLWPAQPGKHYRVFSNDDLNDPNWSELTASIVLNGSTASITDATDGTSGQRFYRVVVEP